MKKIILILVHKIILRTFLKLAIGIRYQNDNVLLARKQFIIVANHNSHLDTIVLLSAIPSSIIHKVHPVAAADYFAKSKLRSFFTRVFINAILIPRSRPQNENEPDPINMMLAVLEKGDSLILFPEGSRGNPEVMQRFKRGIGLLLNKYPTVPIIPVYLDGLGKSLPKGDNILVPFNSLAKFGAPSMVKAVMPEEIAAELEQTILNLKNESK